MFFKTVISFLVVILVPAAPAASTIERLDMAILCQGGRDSGLLGRFHCRLDSQIAFVHVFASRRPGSTYSYDAWGRTRDPETLTPYASTSQPALLLGRGYCGHEHLSNYGLINMNARLYDPVLGRFLSPDPYVQSPDFSQNFNRYAYALNNPLKYTDESGEFIGTILTAAWQLPIAIIKGIIVPYFVGFADTVKAGQMFADAWKEYGDKVANAAKIDWGLFKTDKEHLDPGERFLTVLSRFTREAPQMFIGNFVSHFRNNVFCDINVEYYNGATLVNRTTSSGGWGFTLGSYIQSKNLIADPNEDATFAHEYGHVIQSQKLGRGYLSIVGVPSVIGFAVGKIPGANHNHRNEWYEVWRIIFLRIIMTV